jgi:uncharacterized protein
MNERLNHNDPYILELIKKSVDYLGVFNGVIVAFSGGVDSSILAALSYQALGDRTVAVTMNSHALPKREMEIAKQTAQSIGIKHTIVPFNRLFETGYSRNPVDRCYQCKSGMYEILNMLADEWGFEAVVDGTNVSELTDYRPGYQAVLENGILTPFTDLNITKDEIRSMGYMLGLSVWDKPQQTCMLTRFPYEKNITIERLEHVEKAESYLYELGVRQCRVRDHDDTVRIEIMEKDKDIIIKNKDWIVNYFKELGFYHVVYGESKTYAITKQTRLI